MKNKIDYLFWKRTWFRLIFILIPILPVGLGLLISSIINADGETTRTIVMVSYAGIFLLGILDNNNMDGCDKKLSWRDDSRQ